MKKPHSSTLPEPQQANLKHSSLDAALECCQNIETLAQLLQYTTTRPSAEMVDALLVSNTGYLLGRETEHLRRALHRLHQIK